MKGEKDDEKCYASRILIRNMCMLAMFMAITLVLSYVNEVIPSLPQGGTISVDVIAIMLCGYLMGAGYGVICGVGVALLQLY